MGRSKCSLKQCKSTCFPSTAIGSESLLWRMCTCSTYSPGVIIHKRWPIFVDLHFVQVSVLTVLALYIQGRARYLTFFILHSFDGAITSVVNFNYIHEWLPYINMRNCPVPESNLIIEHTFVFISEMWLSVCQIIFVEFCWRIMKDKKDLLCTRTYL